MSAAASSKMGSETETKRKEKNKRPNVEKIARDVPRFARKHHHEAKNKKKGDILEGHR